MHWKNWCLAFSFYYIWFVNKQIIHKNKVHVSLNLSTWDIPDPPACLWYVLKQGTDANHNIVWKESEESNNTNFSKCIKKILLSINLTFKRYITEQKSKYSTVLAQSFFFLCHILSYLFYRYIWQWQNATQQYYPELIFLLKTHTNISTTLVN